MQLKTKEYKTKKKKKPNPVTSVVALKVQKH